jgi:hypothetical protein
VNSKSCKIKVRGITVSATVKFGHRDFHGKRIRTTGIRNDILTLDRPNDKQNCLLLSESHLLLWRQANALNTLLKQGSGKISNLIYKHSPYNSMRYTR